MIAQVITAATFAFRISTLSFAAMASSRPADTSTSCRPSAFPRSSFQLAAKSPNASSLVTMPTFGPAAVRISVSCVSCAATPSPFSFVMKLSTGAMDFSGRCSSSTRSFLILLLLPKKWSLSLVRMSTLSGSSTSNRYSCAATDTQ